MKIVFVDVELGRVAVEINGHYYIYDYEPPEVEYEVIETEEEVPNENTVYRD